MYKHLTSPKKRKAGLSLQTGVLLEQFLTNTNQ